VVAADAIPWGDSEQLLSDFSTVWSSGSAYLDLADWSEVEPVNRAMRDLGLRTSSHDYVKAVVRLQLFSRRIVACWGRDFDLLLMPTLAMEPPPIGWLTEGGITEPTAVLRRACEMVPYTAWCNITGQPAIALPTHVTPGGLPAGVQLIAPPYHEDLLLQVGTELEERYGWPDTHP
jgi:amidase